MFMFERTHAHDCVSLQHRPNMHVPPCRQRTTNEKTRGVQVRSARFRRKLRLEVCLPDTSPAGDSIYHVYGHD